MLQKTVFEVFDHHSSMGTIEKAVIESDTEREDLTNLDTILDDFWFFRDFSYGQHEGGPTEWNQRNQGIL